MHLKRLELQGYKSFARKTEFVFERGITAIVGPNGSGKSNIADAVRWVLGETRMSQLRAKVTDDLIFAGSDRRARQGMAQVSMTLDNSDGALPIDYTEVTVERRAYRDGQNEYFINNTKVRLRDIVELLGAGGLTRDAYAIISQGLVDMALSLRPQERRALIDVAAGIRPLQDKRDRALAQLDETHDNLTRVRDITAEIAPRLRRLEKQAERSRQGAQIARQLEETLKTWYGYQWHTGQRALRDSHARAAASRQTLSQRRQALAALEQQIESRRDREEDQVDALSDLHEQRARLRAHYEAVRRDLAVRQERMTLLQRRQQELTQEVADLQALRDEQQRHLIETETALAQLSDRCSQLTAQSESIRHNQAGAQRRQAEYNFALEGTRQKVFDLTSTLADLRNRLTALMERQEDLTRERRSQQQAATDLVTQIDNRQAALGEARRRLERHEQALQQLARDHEATLTSLDAATARLDGLRSRTDAARRRLEGLQARRETLDEMRKTGVGSAAGAHALLSAREEIGGIIGPLASLIHVPAQYETAIAAALGPNLHAVVVETWSDAQRAIQWLQANQAGRATLVVSGGAGERGSTGAREHGSTGAREHGSGGTQGSIGVASDFVECEP
ncbi:MAG: chromosome segregation SMC family protein, partial [Anaerolineae bacterium]